MSYHDIAAQGGGIGRTVRATAEATVDELRQIGIKRASIARRSGTTYLEAKSGYGLETQAELNQIQAAHETGNVEGLPGVHATWLGAHAIPQGHTEEQTVERLLSEQLPSVIEQGYAESVDVFCEPGWFSIDSTERIMNEAMARGLSGRLHIDEFVDSGGAALAAKLGVVTADHTLKSSDEGRQALADAEVITGYLPGTPTCLEWTCRTFLQHRGRSHSLRISTRTAHHSASRLRRHLPFIAPALHRRLHWPQSPALQP